MEEQSAVMTLWARCRESRSGSHDDHVLRSSSEVTSARTRSTRWWSLMRSSTNPWSRASLGPRAPGCGRSEYGIVGPGPLGHHSV